MNIHYGWEGKKGSRELVFLHGGTASIAWWARQIPVLSKDYRILLIDLPGHGLSNRIPSHCERSMATLSAILDSIIEKLNMKDPVLVGWSFGGMASLQYVLDHPKKLSALILVDTSPTGRLIPSFGYLPKIPYYWIPDPQKFLPFIKMQLPIVEEVLHFINKSPFRKGVATLLIYLIAAGKKPDKRLVTWATDILLKDLNIRGFLQTCVCVVEFNVIGRLPEIDIPTLIIHGREDRVLHLGYAELLHQRIESSKLKFIEEAGHCPHLEKPKEFNNTVIDFLKQIDSTPF